MKKLLTILMLFVLIYSVNAATSTDIYDTDALSIDLVNQDPDPAIAGDIVEVRISINNYGDTVNDLSITLNPQYPFEMVPGEEALQTIATLKSGQEGDNVQIIKYKIRVDSQASAGTYDLDLSYHKSGTNAIFHKILSIDVKSKASSVGIGIDTTTLIPGKITDIIYTITNDGSSPLRDVKFTWANSDNIILPVGSDNSRYLKNLEVGESQKLNFQVVADTNADAGLYKMDLTLTYDDSLTNTEQTVSTLAGIYVGGGTDFEVAYAESSTTDISFNIANVGSNPANSVTINIPRQQGWTITGSTTAIIGNLNQGDYTVASFNLQSSTTNKTRAKTGNTVKIKIMYTNTMGTRLTVEKQIEINAKTGASYPAMDKFSRTKSQPNFFQQYMWQIVIFVAAIIGYFMYTNYRKKKLTNPKFKIIKK